MFARMCWLALCLALTGCAQNAQVITMRPIAQANNANDLGKGNTVSVKVSDTRPSKIVGRRGDAEHSDALITVGQDFMLPLAQQIVDGLKQYGFKPDTGASNNSRTLTVDVKSLEYVAQSPWLGVKLRIRAALRAVANNNGSIQESSYTVENESWSAFPPSEQENERLINDALSKGLERVINDRELLLSLGR